MRDRPTKWSLVLVAVLALALAACNGDDDSDTGGGQGADDEATDLASQLGIDLPPTCDQTQGVDEDTIRLSVFTDLSGPIAEVGGIDHASAFEAHFETVNENGGIDGRTVEVNVHDTRYDPVEAATQYEEARLDAAMVPIVLGSAMVDAIGEDMSEDCLLTFQGNPNGWLAQRYESVFAPSTTNGHEIANAIGWVIEEQGEEDATFALARQGDAFGENAAQAARFAADYYDFEFETVVDFGPQDTEMTAQVEELVAADPDYVVHGGLPTQLGGLSAGVAAAGADMTFLTQTGGPPGPLMQTPAGEALEANTLLATSYGQWVDDTPGIQQMLDVLDERTDVTPGTGPITGYAVALLTEETLRIASANDDLSLGGLYNAALSIEGFDTEGVVPELNFGEVAEEPRVPSRSIRMVQPSAEAEGGHEPMTDYFTTGVADEYVEPEL